MIYLYLMSPRVDVVLFLARQVFSLIGRLPCDDSEEVSRIDFPSILLSVYFQMVRFEDSCLH